jgi:hypothetical protein
MALSLRDSWRGKSGAFGTIAIAGTGPANGAIWTIGIGRINCSIRKVLPIDSTVAVTCDDELVEAKSPE